MWRRRAWSRVGRKTPGLEPVKPFSRPLPYRGRSRAGASWFLLRVGGGQRAQGLAHIQFHQFRDGVFPFQRPGVGVVVEDGPESLVVQRIGVLCGEMGGQGLQLRAEGGLVHVLEGGEAGGDVLRGRAAGRFRHLAQAGGETPQPRRDVGGLDHIRSFPARFGPLEQMDFGFAAARRALHKDGNAGRAVEVGFRPAQHGKVGSFLGRIDVGPVLVVAHDGPAQAHGGLIRHGGYGEKRGPALVVHEHEKAVQLVGIIAAAGGVGGRFLVLNAAGGERRGRRQRGVQQRGAVFKDAAARQPCVAAHGGGVNGLARHGGIERIAHELAQRQAERLLIIDSRTLVTAGWPHFGGGEGIGGHEIENGRQRGGPRIGLALRRGGQQGGQGVFHGRGKFLRVFRGGGQDGERGGKDGTQQAGGEGKGHHDLETVKVEGPRKDKGSLVRRQRQGRA